MSSSTVVTTFRVEKEKIDKIDAVVYNSYFINEVEKGLQEADNKNFAEPEEVDNIFKKYGVR